MGHELVEAVFVRPVRRVRRELQDLQHVRSAQPVDKDTLEKVIHRVQHAFYDGCAVWVSGECEFFARHFRKCRDDKIPAVCHISPMSQQPAAGYRKTSLR